MDITVPGLPKDEVDAILSEVYVERAHCSGRAGDVYVFSLDGGGMYYPTVAEVEAMDVSPEWGTRWIVRFSLGGGLLGLALTHLQRES